MKFLFYLDSFGEYISGGDWLFNSTYVRGGDTNNNIDIIINECKKKKVANA